MDGRVEGVPWPKGGPLSEVSTEGFYGKLEGSHARLWNSDWWHLMMSRTGSGSRCGRCCERDQLQGLVDLY